MMRTKKKLAYSPCVHYVKSLEGHLAKQKFEIETLEYSSQAYLREIVALGKSLKRSRRELRLLRVCLAFFLGLLFSLCHKYVWFPVAVPATNATVQVHQPTSTPHLSVEDGILQETLLKDILKDPVPHSLAESSHQVSNEPTESQIRGEESHKLATSKKMEVNQSQLGKVDSNLSSASNELKNNELEQTLGLASELKNPSSSNEIKGEASGAETSVDSNPVDSYHNSSSNKNQVEKPEAGVDSYPVDSDLSSSSNEIKVDELGAVTSIDDLSTMDSDNPSSSNGTEVEEPGVAKREDSYPLDSNLPSSNEIKADGLEEATNVGCSIVDTSHSSSNEIKTDEPEADDSHPADTNPPNLSNEILAGENVAANSADSAPEDHPTSSNEIKNDELDAATSVSTSEEVTYHSTSSNELKSDEPEAATTSDPMDSNLPSSSVEIKANGLEEATSVVCSPVVLSHSSSNEDELEADDSHPAGGIPSNLSNEIPADENIAANSAYSAPEDYPISEVGTFEDVTNHYSSSNVLKTDEPEEVTSRDSYPMDPNPPGSSNQIKAEELGEATSALSSTVSSASHSSFSNETKTDDPEEAYPTDSNILSSSDEIKDYDEHCEANSIESFPVETDHSSSSNESKPDKPEEATSEDSYPVDSKPSNLPNEILAGENEAITSVHLGPEDHTISSNEIKDNELEAAKSVDSCHSSSNEDELKADKNPSNLSIEILADHPISSNKIKYDEFGPPTSVGSSEEVTSHFSYSNELKTDEPEAVTSSDLYPTDSNILSSSDNEFSEAYSIESSPVDTDQSRSSNETKPDESEQATSEDLYPVASEPPNLPNEILADENEAITSVHSGPEDHTISSNEKKDDELGAETSIGTSEEVTSHSSSSNELKIDEPDSYPIDSINLPSSYNQIKADELGEVTSTHSSTADTSHSSFSNETKTYEPDAAITGNSYATDSNTPSSSKENDDDELCEANIMESSPVDTDHSNEIKPDETEKATSEDSYTVDSEPPNMPNEILANQNGTNTSVHSGPEDHSSSSKELKTDEPEAVTSSDSDQMDSNLPNSSNQIKADEHGEVTSAHSSTEDASHFSFSNVTKTDESEADDSHPANINPPNLSDENVEANSSDSAPEDHPFAINEIQGDELGAATSVGSSPVDTCHASSNEIKTNELEAVTSGHSYPADSSPDEFQTNELEEATRDDWCPLDSKPSNLPEEISADENVAASEVHSGPEDRLISADEIKDDGLIASADSDPVDCSQDSSSKLLEGNQLQLVDDSVDSPTDVNEVAMAAGALNFDFTKRAFNAVYSLIKSIFDIVFAKNTPANPNI